MKAINFKEATLQIAENQPEYITLPAYYGQLGENPGETGLVTCFELSLDELENVVKYGKIWHTQMTFGAPMQPIMLWAGNDFFNLTPETEPVLLDLELMEKDRFEWSLATFPKSTTQSALEHLKDEIKEIEKEPKDVVEYADALALLLEAAGRSGIEVTDILVAYRDKMKLNKSRTWEEMPNGSYKHVKES